jgi:hypothetical protein
MTDDTYNKGYRAGWESVAGSEPLPANPTRPSKAALEDYTLGFKYGRADALEQFRPGSR